MVVFICFLSIVASCVDTKTTSSTAPVSGVTDSTKKWINWVGVFKTDTDSTIRSNYLNAFVSQLNAVRSDDPVTAADSTPTPLTYLLSTLLQATMPGRPYQVTNVAVQFCNCPDSLLFNVTADLSFGPGTGTSGPSTPTPPAPGSGTKVSGDLLDALAFNETMENPSHRKGGSYDANTRVSFPAGYSMSRAILAFIDTGIDTLLFDETLRKEMLWNGPSGPQNLLMGAEVEDYKDDHPIRHGTAVATIAMTAFHRESGNKQLPKLMVLKAADSTGRGTLFEYACGFAFAIRNHATIINSSMGFYGQPNEAINHYVSLAHRDSILIVAAAGNADGDHSGALCRVDINASNLLQAPSRMYYPAVMSQNMEQYSVVSVTGMSSPGQSCYFQNHSESYVTVGVLNDLNGSSCCSYKVPFITNGFEIEGSSFATPVVAGRIGYRVSKAGPRSTVRHYLALLGNVNQGAVAAFGRVTLDNMYFLY
jgi:hypothetical protein